MISWKEMGFVLNNASGKIKQSSDGGLLQSSTVAQMIEAEFAEGDKHTISDLMLNLQSGNITAVRFYEFFIYKTPNTAAKVLKLQTPTKYSKAPIAIRLRE